MKFIEMKEGVPAKYHNLQQQWKEFMALNIKTAKVELEEGEYKSIYVAQRTMTQSIERGGFPIKVHTYNGELYLTRKDM